MLHEITKVFIAIKVFKIQTDLIKGPDHCLMLVPMVRGVICYIKQCMKYVKRHTLANIVTIEGKMFRIWSKNEGVNSNVILGLPCVIQFKEALA